MLEKARPGRRDCRDGPWNDDRPNRSRNRWIMNNPEKSADTPAADRAEDALVSVIVPVYNEEEAIGPFLEAAMPVLAETGCRREILFVNDGSTDRTLEALRAAKKAEPDIAIVNLARNFGKEAAMTAGLDKAKGEAVVILDVDLQDPPELIPDFLEKWREGYDIVFGYRESRKSDSLAKALSARWFYRLFNRVARVPIPENAGDFRLMDRRVVKAIGTLRERNRFMKGLMAWPGFKSVGIPFERPERAAGQTTWSFWKLWNFAIDGITSFSTVPLRLWVYIGSVLAFLSMLYALFIIIKVLTTGVDVPGYASLMVAVTFLGGVQLVSLGVIGEYLGRLYEEVKERPIYVIDAIER
jgi:glycosyltransferase involved in cell wall biosynthesis